MVPFQFNIYKPKIGTLGCHNVNSGLLGNRLIANNIDEQNPDIIERRDREIQDLIKYKRDLERRVRQIKPD